MNREMKDCVALVTGASRGIGKGIAAAFGEVGATVYVTARSTAAKGSTATGTLEETAQLVEELGGRAIMLPCDHMDDAQVESVFEKIKKDAGRLDVLVNNAFKIPDPPVFGGNFWEHPVSIWDDMLGVGLRGHYAASRHAAAMMVEQGSGLIANISARGAASYKYSVAYGVGKCALDRMAADMAHELKPYGVHAVSIWPGAVRTEFIVSQKEAGIIDIDLDLLESPRFTGRAIIALFNASDLAEMSGGVYKVADLARAYGFTDTNGRVPEAHLNQ